MSIECHVDYIPLQCVVTCPATVAVGHLKCGNADVYRTTREAGRRFVPKFPANVVLTHCKYGREVQHITPSFYRLVLIPSGLVVTEIGGQCVEGRAVEGIQHSVQRNLVLLTLKRLKSKYRGSVLRDCELRVHLPRLPVQWIRVCQIRVCRIRVLRRLHLPRMTRYRVPAFLGCVRPMQDDDCNIQGNFLSGLGFLGLKDDRIGSKKILKSSHPINPNSDKNPRVVTTNHFNH